MPKHEYLNNCLNSIHKDKKICFWVNQSEYFVLLMFVFFFPTFDELCLGFLTITGWHPIINGNFRSETQKYLV